MTIPERLRPHPQDRFRDPAQLFDLKEAAARLRAEPHAAVEGHRQIALFRHGQVTVVLYLFEPEGHIRQHQTEGVVTIHALVGRLLVTADGSTHQVSAGQMVVLAPGVPLTAGGWLVVEIPLVVLAPGVPLTVRATMASEMLFTVHHTEE